LNEVKNHNKGSKMGFKERHIVEEGILSSVGKGTLLGSALGGLSMAGLSAISGENGHLPDPTITGMGMGAGATTGATAGLAHWALKDDKNKNSNKTV
jgi:hypothetical protein